MKTPAIYVIRNLRNGKVYIGSSYRAERRLWEHEHFLKNGTHYSLMLTRAWAKHGPDAFEFSIHEAVDRADLLVREQFWIDHFQSADGKHGYNACPVAGTREGSLQSDAAKQAMSRAHLGKPKSAEQRAKMSAAALGKVKSPEHRQRLREATQRQFADPEARRLASERQTGKPSSFKGRRHSPEMIEKLKAAAQARWEGVPRKPKIVRPYVPKPKDQHLKTGPKKGTPRPERRGFTDEQVREIRDGWLAGESSVFLGRKFGKNPSIIMRIVKRQTYANID